MSEVNMRILLDILIGLWLYAGFYNWKLSKNQAPKWFKLLIGLPVCLILGPIPILPLIFGMKRQGVE